MDLREWLYGKPLGECDTVTPPRDGERVEFRGTMTDYIRAACLTVAACREYRFDFDAASTFPSALHPDVTGAD